MFTMLDRKQVKAQARELTRNAQVSAFAMTAAFLGIALLLRLVDTLVSGNTYESLMSSGMPGIFVNILVTLITLVLQAGFSLYCLAVHRGERAEFLTLFDGFSFVGKVILLFIQEYIFITLWSMLFLIPGIVASYRYRFALYNLCENPALSPAEAIAMSKAQTMGHKMDLFILDLSFFGWMLLSTLPIGIVNGLALNGISLPLPALVVTLLCGLFSGAVDLWRLPYQTLAEIGYYDFCKTSSGVGTLPGNPDAPLPTKEDKDDTNFF